MEELIALQAEGRRFDPVNSHSIQARVSVQTETLFNFAGLNNVVGFVEYDFTFKHTDNIDLFCKSQQEYEAYQKKILI